MYLSSLFFVFIGDSKANGQGIFCGKLNATGRAKPELELDCYESQSKARAYLATSSAVPGSSPLTMYCL